MGELVSGAGSTFAAIGEQAQALQSALTETPGTFASLRQTLARADQTLGAADALSRTLRPGVAALGTLTAPLQSMLSSLVAVGPDARQTLATAGAAAPDLVSVLSRTEGLMPVLGNASQQAAKQLACIRPYAPEIAGFASDWGAGAWSRGDQKDKYVRAALGASPVPYATTLNSGQLHGLVAGVKKVEFRPPGELVDQPWFQPHCGTGPEVLSPGYDPEAQQRASLSRGHGAQGGQG
jgi:phospholipid/cholesterol/gamma-HCH transport system substrate-binding protein